MIPPPSLPPHPHPAGDHQAETVCTRIHDIEWDRLIFRAPALPNPQIIFDPPPFRSQQPIPKAR